MPTTHKTEFKYEVWAEELRAKIKRGELAPGDRLPSFSDMKEQHSLSRPTVERIHALLEQEGLIVREERRGAFVTAQKPPESNIIGVFIPPGNQYFHHPYILHLLAGIREVASETDHEVLLLGSPTAGESSKFGWTHVGGVLTLAVDDLVLASLMDAMPPGMPCITLVGESRRALSVTCDDYHGSMELTETLIAQGHRRIAALITQTGLVPRRRIEGYQQALRDAHIAPQANWLWGDVILEEPEQGFVEAANAAMLRWLENGFRELGCTAIIAQNDESAIGVIEALQEAGVRVPEHISVAGFDGTDLARHFQPRLTTVEVPLHEIGVRGAKWLIEQMKASRDGTWSFEAATRETVVLSPRLRMGESTSRVLSG